MRSCKLVMASEANNNKFYNMEDDGSTITCKYGRVGVTEAVATYPSHKWNSIISSKVKKGYKDVTHLFIEDNIEVVNFADISDNEVSMLIAKLQAYSKKQVSTFYNVTAEKVTQKQIDEAQVILNALLGCTDHACANRLTLDLYMTIPRRMGNVKDHLLRTFEQKTLESFIGKEQDLLDSMASQVKQVELVRENKDSNLNILDAMGLQLLSTTPDEVSNIKLKLDNLAHQYSGSFRVTNKKSNERFTKYVESAKNQKVELFWHGSRNENWISILETGLVLRPTNAVISGKMFGYGTYAADKAQKSYGYTSGRGSYWANGSANEAYMALFNFHVGNQLHVKRHEGWHSSLDEKRLREKGEYDSLFAEGGADLRNNEYIVYNENQTDIQFIVQLKS